MQSSKGQASDGKAGDLLTQRRVTDNLEQLLEALPPRVREAVEALESPDTLIEIVLDLGRLPEARFPQRFVYLDDQPVTREDLEYVVKRVGKFGQDNRAGIERTLHRISAIRNRQQEIIGLTCRIGRAVYGTIDIVRDVVEKEKNILLLGKPGVGKTTMLREVARVLADEFNKRVIVVDTSNEIAGDGDIPHPAIGHARRMQVPQPDRQAEVMIEAVENHMPEVIVIDEIGTLAEAQAARTIAERGVQLIATAHGITLENLVLNPTLSDLVGGIQTVTLGDEEARKRGTQKTVLERKAPPTFDVVIEIQTKDRFAIHHDVAAVVDALLRGYPPRPEVRERDEEGRARLVQPAGEYLEPLLEAEDRRFAAFSSPEVGAALGRGATRFNGGHAAALSNRHPFRIYPYAVSTNRLERAIEELKAPIQVVKDLEDAEIVLTLKGQYRKMPRRLREAEQRGLPIHVIRSNTLSQISSFLQKLIDLAGEGSPLSEAEEAIRRVQDKQVPVELSPQNSFVRRLQHQLAAKYQLYSESVGEEPNRRVTIFPRL